MGIEAKVIKDSISPAGDRLTTQEARIHRFILAELNTHRSHSRNSASSRAIPVHKQIRRVMEDPAMPVSWPVEKPGMSGGEELEGGELAAAQDAWLAARWEMVKAVTKLTGSGLDNPLHKSVANRLLEPFMWHTVIFSATDAGWENFFGLRCSPRAQPEMRVAAEAMRAAYRKSTPTLLEVGQWHLPYIREDEVEQGTRLDLVGDGTDWRKVSAARCARVSYLTHDGVRDVEKDLELYAKLVHRDDEDDPPHSSPLEHVATPALTIMPAGNFDGFHQFRHFQ